MSETSATYSRQEEIVALQCAMIARLTLLRTLQKYAGEIDATLPKEGRPKNLGALVVAAWSHALAEAVQMHDTILPENEELRNAYAIVAEVYKRVEEAQRAEVGHGLAVNL